MKASLKIISIIIGSGFLLTQLSSSTFLPSMPSAMDYFSTTTHGIKAYISFFFVGYAIGQLTWGSLSDKYGRRMMWILASALYAFSAICTVFTGHLPEFFFFYGLIGFAAASYTSVGNAILKDLFGKDNVSQAIAAIGIVMACGPALGSAIGTTLTDLFNWKAIFLFFAVFSLMIFFNMCYVVPETLTKNKGEQDHTTFVQRCMAILSTPQFIRSILILGSSFGILMATMDAAPFILTNYLHVSTYISGWLLMLATLSYIIGAVIVTLNIKHTSIIRLTAYGIILMCIGMALLLSCALTDGHSIYCSLLSISAMLLAVGMLVPLGKAGCMTATESHSGTTASLMKFIQTCFAIGATVIASQINTSTSFLPIAALLIGLSIITIVAFLVWRSA